jgi:hypothetical protein
MFVAASIGTAIFNEAGYVIDFIQARSLSGGQSAAGPRTERS